MKYKRDSPTYYPLLTCTSETREPAQLSTDNNGRCSDFKLHEENPELTSDNVILHSKRYWDGHHEVRRYTKYYLQRNLRPPSVEFRKLKISCLRLRASWNFKLFRLIIDLLMLSI